MLRARFASKASVAPRGRRAAVVAASTLGLALLAGLLAVVPMAASQDGCLGSAPTITGSGMIIGTDGDDVILGSDGDDLIGGGGGNDKICGGDGDDRLGGGPGNDEIDGGPGNDEIHGGPGDDTILGGDGDDVLRGGPDDDTCDGGAGTNTAPTTGFEACETVENAGEGSGDAPKHALKAKLNRRQEVPRPRGARRARGRFRATLKPTEDGGVLRWRLRFRRLSGRAVAAHIHRGKRGRAGPVVIPLCSPCSSPERGKARLEGRSILRALVMRRAYVNLHTKRNPNGEIRGQIRPIER